MSASKHRFPMWASRVLLALLVGMLVLSTSVVAQAQGRTPDPQAKQLPLGGLPSLKSQVSPSVLPAEAATAANIVRDPSFEYSYNTDVYWHQESTNFGTPLCTTADCGNGAGTAGSRTGSVWAWFGGVDFSDPFAVSPEGAIVSQHVFIPSCGAVLRFYFWIGQAAAGSGTDDFFVANLNGTQLFRAYATQRSSYPNYKLVTVNITPAMAAGGGDKVLMFGSVVSDQLVTFNLDDVTIIPNCLVVSGNAGVGGATLSYTGGSTTSDVSGNYSFNVPIGWSGMVTPSLAHYTFAPLSRTYSGLVTYQFNQNYTANPIRHTISGSTGIGGVTFSYIDDVPPGRTVTSQPDGQYSITVREVWNGTLTPTHSCFSFTPANRTYTGVPNNLSGENYTPAFDTGAGCADINAEIGGTNRGRFGLLPGESTRASFASLNSGPAKITSTNALPLIGAERVIYKIGGVNTSFTELMGLPDNQVDTTYWLPWYNNRDLDTQLRIANVSGSTATVHIFIGTNEVTPVPDGLSLPVGGSTRLSYPDVNDGPVKIVSDQPIVAAERVIYTVLGVKTSYSEMIALPESQVDTTYWLPWYNNVDLDTQLRIANVSATDATVHIFIGANEVTPVAGLLLSAGASQRLSYPGVNSGPVKIVSDQDIVAAERVIYKINNRQTSYTEMMGLPESQLDTTYWLPWYNNKDLDTQLRIANVGVAATTVHIFIGGQELGSGLNLQPGQSTRLSFVNINAGPVQIVSDQNIVAAERVIYTINGVRTSYSEMMALPDLQLDDTYWFPWYNNRDLDTQLRFGVPQP